MRIEELGQMVEKNFCYKNLTQFRAPLAIRFLHKAALSRQTSRANNRKNISYVLSGGSYHLSTNADQRMIALRYVIQKNENRIRTGKREDYYYIK